MKSVMKVYYLVLLVLLTSVFDLMASMPISNQQIFHAVDFYYHNIQVYADETGKASSLEARNNIKGLFLDPNSVINDLNPYNSDLPVVEDDVENYLSVILNLAGHFHYFMNFSYEIDQNSIVKIEDLEDNQIKNAGAGEPLCWVTVNKTISFLNHPENTFTRKETFKFKGSQIERICSPEQSTAIIDGLRFYRQGDYDKAYETFLKQIEFGRASEDTYWYLGLMFRKHKVSFYSNKVSDKLCVFYWNKCWRGRQALAHLGVDYVNNHSLDQKSPFNNGLMVVYKGNKYGYMDIEGKMVIPYSYSDAWDFSEGLALVKTSRGYGFIDSAGREILPCQYSYALPFERGCAVVEKEGWRGAINAKGEVIVPFQYKFLKYYPTEGYFLYSTDDINYFELHLDM